MSGPSRRWRLVEHTHGGVVPLYPRYSTREEAENDITRLRAMSRDPLPPVYEAVLDEEDA